MYATLNQGGVLRRDSKDWADFMLSCLQFVSVNYIVGVVAANNLVVAVVDLC